jgi:D-3-phosphoglycerate dehydrogenase
MTVLKSCKVLVTPTSFGKYDPNLKRKLEEAVGQVVYNPLSRPLTSQELQPLLAGCDGFIAGLDMIDRAAIESSDRLKVIARYGVGVERVDLAAARERGICVTNTPGANTTSVAELTVALILALARQLPAAVQATKAGEWPRLLGCTLEGKTVGLLGFGNIGQAVAARLKPFECRLIAYDPLPKAETAARIGVELMPFETVAQEADFLSLHLPSTAETQRMINAAFLKLMKRGSYLVNTARGDLVDEEALYESIQSGHIAGAALDCFSVEPPNVDHPLFQLPQVIITPHMGGHTDRAANAMGWAALNNCLAVLRGEQPIDPVI